MCVYASIEIDVIVLLHREHTRTEGKMNRRLIQIRRIKLGETRLLAWGLVLGMFFVNSTAARSLSSGTSATTTVYQNYWSPGETVLVRVDFSNPTDLTNYAGGNPNTKQINYTQMVGSTNYKSSWPWLRDSYILSDSSSKQYYAVSTFSAIQPAGLPRDSKRETTPQPSPQAPVGGRRAGHGTGTGTVVYTDAKGQSQTLSGSTLTLYSIQP